MLKEINNLSDSKLQDVHSFVTRALPTATAPNGPRQTSSEDASTKQFRALLANTDLTNLQVVWSFQNVPDEVISIFDLGELMVDGCLVADDEISRFSQVTQEVLTSAWHIDRTISPLVGSIWNGNIDIDGWYEGEDLATEISRLQSTRNDDSEEWAEDEGTDIRYVGPTYEILFPLNPLSDAALSLGKRSDDPADIGPTLIWHEDYPDLFELTNYGFKVSKERSDQGFQITWNYNRESLLRSVGRSSEARITAAFPRHFSFLIASKSLKKQEYLSHVARHLRSVTQSVSNEPILSWDRKSTLNIYVNGPDDAHYIYEVEKYGPLNSIIDNGAYDEPEFEYEFMRFDCRLLTLS